MRFSICIMAVELCDIQTSRSIVLSSWTTVRTATPPLTKDSLVVYAKLGFPLMVLPKVLDNSGVSPIRLPATGNMIDISRCGQYTLVITCNWEHHIVSLWWLKDHTTHCMRLFIAKCCICSGICLR